MNIFKRIFGYQTEETKTNEILPESTSEENGSEKDKEETTESQETERKEKTYTISYGTHMPIDAIYIFLGKDFEDLGYKDAMCSVDGAYKESGERIIRNELKTLFRRVNLRYQTDMRSLMSTIKLVREQGLLDQALALETKKETIEEHLKELKIMENDLDNNEATMMRPIDSYSRGFLKGLTAKTNALLND